MFNFPEQYGGTQKGIQVTTVLLQEEFTQLGLGIDNGSTAFNFIDEDHRYNPSNQKIEAYPFLKYKLRI